MRLIDADALIEAMEDVDSWLLYDDWGNQTVTKDLIDNAPTIAIKATAILLPPHGRWKDIDGDGYYWECSACGEVLCCNNNFCPNCGAKMDGERSDNANTD